MDDRLLVMRMVAFIEQHLLEDLQGRELVRISGYSDNRLREKFYSITGDTPSGYIRKRRLTEAAKAIMAGERIADVALRHGYSSQDNFTTAFKSWFGITPGEVNALDSKYRTFFARIKEPLSIMQIANLKQLPLNTTLMGCIKGAVDYYEMDTSVPALFGLTSHAFLINLHETLCPSSPYVWNHEEFFRLLEGIGIRRAAGVERKKGATEAEIQETQERVMQHLRAGNLCMLDYLEHQLVSGYDEKGFVFLRPWDCMSPSELPALSFGTWEECLAKEGWVHFTLLMKSGTRRDFKEQLKDSLSVALSMFARPEPFQVPGYRVGLGAWETWIGQVKKGAGAEHGHWWNASVWSECRLMAGDFFREIDPLLPPRARKTAADLSGAYKEMGTLLFGAREKTLPAAEQVTRLETCLAREREAVGLLEQLAAAL